MLCHAINLFGSCARASLNRSFRPQYLWVHSDILQEQRSFHQCALLSAFMLIRRIFLRKIILAKDVKIAKFKLRFIEFFSNYVKKNTGLYFI